MSIPPLVENCKEGASVGASVLIRVGTPAFMLVLSVLSRTERLVCSKISDVHEDSGADGTHESAQCIFLYFAYWVVLRLGQQLEDGLDSPISESARN